MSEDDADLEANLLRATTGDLDAFRHLEQIADDDVDAFRRAPLPQLTLTRAALTSVLTMLRADEADRDVVERWAFFMLRTYLKAGGTGPTIDVDIDMDMDQLVVDIVNRLSMYDDLPGPVTDGEMDGWMHALTDPAAFPHGL